VTEVVTIGDATLYLGDCMEVLPTLGRVDAVVCDPPYGIAHKSGGGTGGKWDFVRHQGVTIQNDAAPFDPAHLIALGVPMVAWGANFYSDKMPGGGWLVWDKRPGIEDMKFNRSDAELAYISTTKTVKTFRHLWHGLCRATEVGQHLHPTQKPVALMHWCIEQIGKAETILDPYMGAGATGVAAIQMGRKFIGCEIEQAYFDIACERISRAQAQGQMFPPEQVKQVQETFL
jgi:site-specific DNA-methyltransferase (adenine-specific)